MVGGPNRGLSGDLSVGPDASGRTVHIAAGRICTDPVPGARQLLCQQSTLHPGAVNAHTHLYSGLAPLGMPAALPPPQSFLEILERVWWRLDRALDTDSLRASADLAVAEALLLGTTSLVDHHESPARIEGSLNILADSITSLGARALLCYGITDRNGGRDEARAGLAECERLHQRVVALGPTSPLRALVGIHASFTVSDDSIRAAGALCHQLNTPLHVHVAEDLADVEDAIRRGYPGPLERLVHLDCLPPGSIIAHGVHLSPLQITLTEARRCWMVHNPRSNEGNGVGFAANLTVTDRCALGTDGWLADMGAERAAGERLGLSRTLAQARLEAGHRLISEYFAAAPQPLSPGALGDLVVRRDGAVQHVIVNGRQVVADGQLVGADLSALRARAQLQADALWQRMATLAAPAAPAG